MGKQIWTDRFRKSPHGVIDSDCVVIELEEDPNGPYFSIQYEGEEIIIHACHAQSLIEAIRFHSDVDAPIEEYDSHNRSDIRIDFRGGISLQRSAGTGEVRISNDVDIKAIFSHEEWQSVLRAFGWDGKYHALALRLEFDEARDELLKLRNKRGELRASNFEKIRERKKNLTAEMSRLQSENMLLTTWKKSNESELACAQERMGEAERKLKLEMQAHTETRLLHAAENRSYKKELQESNEENEALKSKQMEYENRIAELKLAIKDENEKWAKLYDEKMREFANFREEFLRGRKGIVSLQNEIRDLELEVALQKGKCEAYESIIDQKI